MRKAFNIIGLALALLLAFSSCQKAPFLTFTGQKSFTFKDAGGSETITFSCNRAWTVTSSESWLTVSPAKGEANEGGVNVTITCAANTTYDPRTATVTILSEGLTETISVSQDTNYGLMSEPATFNLTSDAQNIEVEVKANVEYIVTIDDACKDWISQAGTKALSSTKLTFSIAANETYDHREGKITIQQTDGSLKETITVKQWQKDAIIIDENLYSFPSTGGTAIIKGTTNVDVIIEIPSEYSNWISAAQTKGLVSFSREVIVQPNDTYVEREATIYVTEEKSNIRQAITIKEAQLDYVQLCDLELTANRIDTTLVTKVKYNIDFTPAIDADWISLEPATLSMEGMTRGEDGLVEAELKVKIKENPSYTYRVSHITNDFGSAPSVLTLTQSPIGFKEFEGYTYKTIAYGGSEWFKENLKAKFGQTEGNTVNEYGYGNIPGPEHFWAEQGGEMLYSFEGLTYSIYHSDRFKTICPEGWHISTKEDWQNVFSLGSSTNPMQFIRKELGGSDDFLFGGNYGKWHAGSYWLEMGLCQLFQDGAIINNDGVSTEQRSVNEQHPYPSGRFRHIRCVRGPVAPIVQTLPVIKQTTTSAELRVGALNGQELAKAFYITTYDTHSKITKVVFKYGTTKDNLSSSISTNGANMSVELSGLAPGTVYYYQPIVEYEGGKEPVNGEVMSFKTHDGKLEYQGKTYYTTVFNGVEWMTRNLEAENLNDGTPIPNVKEASAWSSTTEPAQCTFRNENSTLDTYGRYYNKYAINTNKICPEGWRLPTTNDFSSNWYNPGYGSAWELLGISNYFCLADLTYYANPVFGNNLSGFSALPSGSRPAEENRYSGEWENFQLKGCDFFTWITYMFSTPEIGVLHIQNMMGVYESVTAGPSSYSYQYTFTDNSGCPVRCVREKQ